MNEPLLGMFFFLEDSQQISFHRVRLSASCPTPNMEEQGASLKGQFLMLGCLPYTKFRLFATTDLFVVIYLTIRHQLRLYSIVFEEERN
jgi:hypothetical protein